MLVSTKASILVLGGAGYIGSHMIKMLMQLERYNVVCVDNLSTGHEDSVRCKDFLLGDIGDAVFLNDVFDKHSFDAVVHFAAFSQVGESISNPLKYYKNNVVNTLNLLDVMLKHGVKKMVFSSTAAIFGEPNKPLIDENHEMAPINPYGKSKLMVESILKDFDDAYGLRSICLRYFNAAGNDELAEIGERHNPETHLIPLVLQTVSGRRDNITIFGADYPTPDGTCVRDYVHVYDLCSAHVLAIDSLLNGDGSSQFNLGNGDGYSVKQVIDSVAEVTKIDVPVVYGDRRAGDPARLVANSQKAKEVLGWKPTRQELKLIIDHAWLWEKNLMRTSGDKN